MVGVQWLSGSLTIPKGSYCGQQGGVQHSAIITDTHQINIQGPAKLREAEREEEEEVRMDICVCYLSCLYDQLFLVQESRAAKGEEKMEGGGGGREGGGTTSAVSLVLSVRGSEHTGSDEVLN